MRGLLRPYHPAGFGLGPMLFLVFAPAWLAVCGYAFVFTCNLLSVNWQHLVLNLYLVGFLGLAYFAWLLFRFSGAVSAGTGVGFVLAGYALAVRVGCEFLVSLLGVPAGTRLPELGTEVAWARGAGLVGLAFGLAVVAASCIAERRLRRRVPAWTLPR